MSINNEPTIEPRQVTGIFVDYIAKTLPMAFDDSMSYYECLCTLLKYINDTIVPDINNVNSGLGELQEFYEELQSYVNNYFDNLDVQEEINNKLDQMATDGTLTNLIKDYVDPIYEAYENSINATVAEQNDSIDIINNKVNAAVTYTPIPVADISEMTDTTKLYLNTTNGKWYYYDGDSWEIGGTYQGTELSTTDENRIKALETQVYIMQLNFTNAGFIQSSNGVYAANEYLRCTDLIPVKNFNKIYLQVLNYAIAASVAYYDSNGTYMSEDSIVGTTYVLYDTITIPDDAAYVRISNYTNNNPHPFAYMWNDQSLAFEFNYLKDDLSLYDDIKSEILNINANFSVDGEYITGGGAIAAIAGCKRTDFINVKGYEKISYSLNLAASNNIVSYYDKNKKYLSEVSIKGGGTTKTEVVTIPESAYYVIFSNYMTNLANPYAILYKENSLLSKVNSNNSILNGKKIGYLGDSITNGYLASMPFRTIITNNTGSTQYNYGINSSTLSDYEGGIQAVVNRYTDMDASLDYICVLIGTNDWAPMGEENSSNTETFYGALNTLIEGLITRYTSKKIMFMTLLPRRNNNETLKNEAIRKRCAYYSIPCFDLYINSNMNPNIDIVNTTLFANSDGLHPNDLGHAMLANKIQKALESI